MRCFEESVEQLTGKPCPTLDGDDWAAKLAAHLAPLGYAPRFIVVDERCIVSRRLTNGKVHAEVMFPTLVTVLEKL